MEIQAYLLKVYPLESRDLAFPAWSGINKETYGSKQVDLDHFQGS